VRTPWLGEGLSPGLPSEPHPAMHSRVPANGRSDP
jgi:hypothetical protein